ncbi:MAG: hypothetical protein WKF59_08750 [Chitinophagaceae bacterium]
MNSRSKKYYESRKAQQGDKKGSATNAGYDEQNEKTVKQPKKIRHPLKARNIRMKIALLLRMIQEEAMSQGKERMIINFIKAL